MNSFLHRLLQLPEDVQMLVWRFVYTRALNQLLDKFKAAEMLEKMKFEMEYDMEYYYAYGDRDDENHYDMM